jgi:methanogenic corrinoid protein MtbC1
MYNLKEFSDNLERTLLTLDRVTARQIIHESFQYGSSVTITGELISNTLKRIGEQWENGELSLSQVYMSGMICEEMVEEIFPDNISVVKDQPKIAIGVYEDYHMLGKRIIYSSLKASGINLIDLGGGLHDVDLINIIIKDKIKILLLSVLMLPSALHIRYLKEKLLNTGVILVVGGAPFRLDNELWKETGADYFGKDSADALNIVLNLIGVPA